MKINREIGSLVQKFRGINDYFPSLDGVDREDKSMLYNKYFDQLSKLSKEIMSKLGYELNDPFTFGKYSVYDNRGWKMVEVDCKSLPHYHDGKWVEYSPSDNIGMAWVCQEFEIKANFVIINLDK